MIRGICTAVIFCLFGVGCGPVGSYTQDVVADATGSVAAINQPVVRTRAAPVLAQTPLARALGPALLNGPTLATGRAGEAVEAAGVADARADWRPSIGLGLEASVSTASDSSTTPVIRLSQRVFDGGNSRYRLRAAESRTVVAAAQTTARVGERALAAIRAWEDLYLARTLVDLAQVSVARHDDIGAKVAMRVDAGAGRNAEVLRVASRRAEAQALFVSAASNVTVAESRLREIFGTLPVVGPLPAPPPAASSVTSNPAVRALLAEADAVRRDRDAVVAAARAPTVFLDVTGSASQQSDPALGAGLRVDYQFGTDGRRAAALSVAEANITRVRADIALALRDLERAAANARTQQSTLDLELRAARDAAKTAQAALADAETQFDGGRVDILDVLELGRDVDRTTSRVAQLESERRSSGYVNLFISGELLDVLGVCIEGCIR